MVKAIRNRNPVLRSAYTGLDYLDPNNLNQKIKEEENPTPYTTPAVVPDSNTYYLKQRPSFNLSMINPNPTNIVPLQYTTYDQLDSRIGSAQLHPYILPVEKLKMKGADTVENYLKNLTVNDIM